VTAFFSGHTLREKPRLVAMRPKRSTAVEGTKPSASKTVTDPGGERERPDFAPLLDGTQSYREGTLSDAEKAYLDFLVDKAIEAWLKR
jgi:hypothetical protein